MFNINPRLKSINRPGSAWGIFFRYPFLAILIISLILSTTGYAVFAQQADGPWYEVRSIFTSEYGLASPRGLAYSPIAGAFLAWDQLGAVTGITMREDPLDTQGLRISTEDFRDIAFNNKTKSLFILNNKYTQLNEFSVNAKGLPRPATGPSKKYDLQSLSLQSVQGITFDPNNGFLYLLNEQGTQLVIVTPGAASQYDGTAAIRERRVTRIDLAGLGYPAMQGIAFNPSNNHIYLSDPIGRKVYEITKNGQEQSTFDLSSLNLVNPQTLLFAPSGDQTDNPNKQSLFILDGTPATVSTTPEKLSGVKFASPLFAAASSGSIVELSLAAPEALPSGTTLSPTTLVHVIDTSKAAWNPSAPDTSGVDYWPLIGGLLVSDSEVDEMTYFAPAYKNVFFSTFSGTQFGSCSTTTPSRTGYSNEPTGVAVNRNNNRIYFTDDDANKLHEVRLGSDGIYCTADDIVTSVNVGTLYNIQDPEDVAYGNNTLFIAGGDDAEVYIIPLGPNGVLAGGDDGPMTHFDTASLGFRILEGLGYDWDRGTLLLVSPSSSDSYVGETTLTGTLIKAYNLSNYSITHREDVTFAPGSQNPAVYSMYISDRGIDNDVYSKENDGKIWEINISGPGTPTPSQTPTATPTITKTPTNTFTPTSTPTNSPTPTNTGTPTPSFTPTNTPTKTFTPTSTPTNSPTNSPTLRPSLTPTNTFMATPTFTPSPTSSVPGQIFADVSPSYWASSYIERLYNAGITGGCSVTPLNYCPDNTVTRAQMAVFLLKGMHGSSYTPPAVDVSTGFTDVATDYWAAAWIKQLAAEGITSGCGSGNYCPDATVTRAQMAIFLLKAKHGSLYSPPEATGVFTDVPVGYWADKWIEQLAVEGITGGCGTGVYCPDDSVTRAQMAVFLVKTFNLP